MLPKALMRALGIDGVITQSWTAIPEAARPFPSERSPASPSNLAGTGEKLDDIEVFHPDRMASRILGMGDVLSLIEQAETKLDEKKAEELAKKLKQNKFDLNDLLSQFQQLKKMGSMKKMLSMIPGVDKSIRDADIDERQIFRIEAIILSMTEEERENPDLLNGSRRKRIAAGCGQKVEDVNRLMKQYEQMKQMFKQFGKKGKRRIGFKPGMMPPPGFKM